MTRATALVVGLIVSSVGNGDIQRTSDGKLDLSGVYNIATVTLIEGPEELGNIKTLASPEAPAMDDGSAVAAQRQRAEIETIREQMPGRVVYERACAECHDGGVVRAPHKEMVSMMTVKAIHFALTDGVMQADAASLSDAERLQVAEYLAGRTLEEDNPPALLACTNARFEFDRPPAFDGWGVNRANTRRIDAGIEGIDGARFAAPELKWAFAFPGANRVRSQPAVAGGLVFVGSHDGAVYALGAETGCVHWIYQAGAEVRTGIVVDPWQAGDTEARPRLYFGDLLGSVYAVDAITGQGVWRHRPDDHPHATITAAPALHEGRLYVSISALEVGRAADPAYECCTFRGSVVAFDAATGEQLWQTFTIAEEPTVQGQNRSGTDMYGPSGATVWNSPAIDVKRGQLYFGTAENASSPATLTSDAIFALRLETGEVVWTYQGTRGDAWNGACDTERDDSCPVENGPDFDFGAAAMLMTTSKGRDLVIGGQKSGAVHALNPDTGELVWQRRVGRGGIQGGVHFGMATDGDRIFVPITDMPDGRAYSYPSRPGLHALDAWSGQPLWYAPAPTDVCGDRKFCHPGISQAITSVSDWVLAGGMDGVMRAHDAATGEVVWSHDASGSVTTTSGDQAHGGSFGGGAGPLIQDGLLLISAGYGIYSHMPGNVLLAFDAGAERAR
ncbi:MAG: PQQ-binding-like beta-propeller repeat protein [Pseudomonadales bacterium]|nr:PQQ-binding-like beta-propeller repeat protein [Pseudomonadales bacterium]